MYNHLFAKALESGVTRQEFIELVPTLGLIELIRVCRRQFELGLHESKVLADKLLAGASPEDAYNKYSQGIISNPTEQEFIAVCKLLQQRMEFGTLFRVLQRWSSIQEMPADFNEAMSWDFTGIFIPNEKHRLRYSKL